MSNSSVQVTFSAQIGQLISGVDQAKEAIRSIGGVVNSAASVFTGFGEAFAGAFAVDQAADFISQMTDLGTSTLRTAAELGVSTTQAQQLGFIAKETGGDANSLALAMERLQLNLQHAQSSTSLQALALKSLGLSAKDLIALPLNTQLDRIADSFAKFADGPNKTAIALELFGRSGADMIPILDRGSAGMDKLRKSAENAGIIVSRDTVTALDNAGTASTTLRASITSLGEAIVAQFSPSIIKAENDLATFTGDLAAMIQTSHFGEYVMAELNGAVREFGVNVAWTAKQLADMAQPWRWNEVLDDWRKGNEGVLAIQKETDDRAVAMAAAAKAQLQKILAAPDPTTKPPPPPLAVPNTAAINAGMSAAQEQIKLADQVYAQQAERLSAEVKLHQITYSQETEALLSALDVRKSAELAAVAAEAGTGNLSVAQAQKIANQKLEIDQKYVQARQKVIDQGVQEEAQKWQGVLQPIESAWNSQLRGMLAGTETFGQAMKKIAGDMVITWIEGAEKMVVNWTAGELAKTTATTAGVAARTGAEQAGASVSLATQIAANLKAIGSDAAKVFADVFAYLSPVMGPFAAAPAAAASALVLGAETLMPSAAIGGYVVSDGLAMIHGGETILPARINQPYSGGAGGGSQNINLNLSAFNPSGLQQVIRQMMPQMARELGSYQQLNPSTA